MKFSDGVEIDTTGPLRITRASDGLYVVGNGMLCAVETRWEGEEFIASLEQRDFHSSDVEDEYEAECDRSLHEWMDEGRVGKPRNVRRR